MSPRFSLPALVCALLLGFGLYLQYARGLEPCPLCLVQRGFFVAVMAACLVAAVHRPGRLGAALPKPPRHETLRLQYGITEVIAKGEHNPVSLGRDFQCAVIILDDLASRRHCTIEQRAGEFVLIDHSTNGTYVTEEGEAEVRLQQASFTLRKHGWLAFGQPRARTDQVVEYFCA